MEVTTGSPAIDHERSYRDGLVPLMIGVTGHRDLVPGEIPRIRERIQDLLVALRERFPDRPLAVLSALAEGADRLVADVALGLGVRLTVVLPMPAELYRADFRTRESQAGFDRLRASATELLELPVISGASPDGIAAGGIERDRHYAQLGVFLCAHSHILLALWDGKPSSRIGGTSQVVDFHHYDVMEGFSPADEVTQQILADDDSDLVYQIVVSRDRPRGEPRPDLAPLEAFWLTTDRHHPRTAELPDKYADIFERTSGFNRNVMDYAERIETESRSLLGARRDVDVPAAARRIDRYFRAADWLAVFYQQRYLKSLKLSHLLVFAMALMFLFYSDLVASQLWIITLAVCLGIAFVVNRRAERGGFHQKYVEYRTLAEGLRVQFFWAVAGVTSGSVTKYSHDNFLQKQDVELGWIRNVMRVSGIACDVIPNRDPGGLSFVLEEWIGDEDHGGQLSYYRIRASRLAAASARLETLGRLAGYLVAAVLITAVLSPSKLLSTIMLVLLGITLLIVALRQAYSFRVAEKDVVRQYEFMYRIFSNARQRLQTATTDRDRRRILRVLGEAALDEHAEWILMHRDRPMSGSQLWRMEG